MRRNLLLFTLLIMGCSMPSGASAQRIDDNRAERVTREIPVTPELLVRPDMLSRDEATGLFDIEAALPSLPPSVRAMHPSLGSQRVRLERLIAAWIRRGRAAGNAGDIYDNRDRGHSRLAVQRYPGLTQSVYDQGLKADDLDYGLNVSMRFPAPTFGNSSTALTNSLFWRSQPRHAMTSQDRMVRLAALYWSNHLYAYPEHRDHDPARGDLYPAAIPYVITSQGSSGSDKPFLQAMALIMASYRPETKAALAERGHLAAVTGMILRRGMKGIETGADYLDGKAHPSVFKRDAIELDRMVALANSITPDRLPPMVRLQLVEAPVLVPGANAFIEGSGETLFVTDAAIAWIGRALAPVWRFVLQADSEAGSDVSFHWRVLRGDAARVILRPLDETGSRVELLIPWHDAFAVPGQPDMRTQRVDIGLFAESEGVLSPPAYFSMSFPPREQRRYAPDGRLLSLVHQPHGGDAPYADPVLFPSADWADRFDYDEDGRLLGWTREIGGETQRFTHHGLLVTQVDALQRPLEARRVRYPVQPAEQGRPATITPTVTDDRFRYRYVDGEDRFGTVKPVE